MQVIYLQAFILLEWKADILWTQKRLVL
ncbi:uncharacterized protein METZ01_LOCUS146985 [marine metagenome]|uniref:Uncharacterized protein n=1 Tax=marine metagenome TaxID=408172 RepID=A0A381ZYT5_9ZZZZ